MIIDYSVAKECQEETWYTCYKCGKCGRVFDEYGIMVDDGGTTIDDGDDEDGH